MTQPLNAQNAYHALEEAAERYCAAHYKWRVLDKAEKSFLAKLANQSDEKTSAGRERWALAHPDYDEFRKGLLEAENESLRAKYSYGNLEIFARLRQTEESTRRTLTR